MEGRGRSWFDHGRFVQNREPPSCPRHHRDIWMGFVHIRVGQQVLHLGAECRYVEHIEYPTTLEDIIKAMKKNGFWDIKLRELEPCLSDDSDDSEQ